ncbi:hypothetical protein E4T43_04732 [Aureobasidium subglaciale]|nr:hypothetical protein E4T43_04732 [Aureobasidium subglaciale]
MAQSKSKSKTAENDTATPGKAHKNTKKNDNPVTPELPRPQEKNGVTNPTPAPTADMKNSETKTIWSKQNLSQWDAPDTSDKEVTGAKHTPPRSNHRYQHASVIPQRGRSRGGRGRGKGGAAPRGGHTQAQPTQRTTQHFVGSSHGTASNTLDTGTTAAAKQTAVDAMRAKAANFAPQAASAIPSSGGSSGVRTGPESGVSHSMLAQSGVTQSNSYRQLIQRHPLKQNEPSADSGFSRALDEVRQAVILEVQETVQVAKPSGQVVAEVIGIEDVTEELAALEAQEDAQRATHGESSEPEKHISVIEIQSSDEKKTHESINEKESRPREIQPVAQKPATQGDLKNDLMRVKSDLTYSEQQLRDLQTKKNESDREVAKLKEQLNKSSVELQAANKETDILCTQLDQVSKAKKPDALEKVQEATAQIEAANRERADSRSQIEQANKKIQSEAARLSDLETGNKALVDQINAASEWSRAARIEFDDLTARARAMKNENMRLGRQVADINNHVFADAIKAAVTTATSALKTEKQALTEQARSRLDELTQSFGHQTEAVRRELEEAKKGIPADTPEVTVTARTSALGADKQAKAPPDSQPCHVCGGLVPNSIAQSRKECVRLQTRVNDLERQLQTPSVPISPTFKYTTVVSSPQGQTTFGITPCSTRGKPPAPPTDCRSCIRVRFDRWVARATKPKEERNTARATVDELQGHIALRSETLVSIDTMPESSNVVFLVANLEIANQETLSALERLYEAQGQVADDSQPADEQEKARLREQVRSAQEDASRLRAILGPILTNENPPDNLLKGQLYFTRRLQKAAEDEASRLKDRVSDLSTELLQYKKFEFEVMKEKIRSEKEMKEQQVEFENMKKQLRKHAKAAKKSSDIGVELPGTGKTNTPIGASVTTTKPKKNNTPAAALRTAKLTKDNFKDPEMTKEKTAANLLALKKELAPIGLALKASKSAPVDNKQTSTVLTASESTVALTHLFQDTYDIKDQEMTELRIKHGENESCLVEGILARDDEIKWLNKELLNKKCSSNAGPAASVSYPKLPTGDSGNNADDTTQLTSARDSSALPTTDPEAELNSATATGASDTPPQDSMEKQLFDPFNVPVTVQKAFKKKITTKDALVHDLEVEKDDLKISMGHLRAGLAEKICQKDETIKGLKAEMFLLEVELRKCERNLQDMAEDWDNEECTGEA